MIEISSSAVIQRPVDGVFSYVTDVRNDPTWHTDILEVRPASEGAVGTGSRYEVTFKPFMGQSQGSITVTDYVPYRRAQLQGSMGPMKPQISYSFEPAEGGTRFTRRVQLEPSGLMRLLSPLMRGMMSKRNAEFLRNLKGVLEAQAPEQPAP